MSINHKESGRKIKTQASFSQSLPRLRISSSKTVLNQQKMTEIVSELRQFPQKWRNASMILKKASINLDVAKRISSIKKQDHLCSPKKILPHPIHLRRSLIKLTDPSIQKQKVLQDDNLVHITAQKWLIYDCLKCEPLKGYKYKKQHDIAGITKILTFYTAYAIIKEYKISIDKTDLIVMKEDQEIQGRKMGFRNQNLLTLQNCLYAMLINSANDAATILANNLGFLCQKRRNNQYFSCFDIKRQNRTKNIKFFISLMKTFASKLELTDTNMNNPHVLNQNYSNAKDVAKLFQACWEIPLFQKIMTSNQRQILIKYVNSEGNLCYKQVFLKKNNQLQNYNKDFIACKTGQNSYGNHNLVSYFQNPQKNKKFIIVVFGSYGRQQKFKDTQRLYQWSQSFSQ